MTKITRRALVASAAALAIAGPALAAGQKSVEAGKVFPFLENYLKLPAPERNRFTLAYYMTRDGKPAANQKGWIGAGATRTPVSTGPDGRVLCLPTLAQLQAKAPLVLDAPESAKFGMNMVVEAAMRPGLELDAAELAMAIAQAAQGAKKAAGLLGVMVPKFEVAAFKGVSSGSAVMADGKVVALPVLKGTPVYNPAKLKGARALKFAKAPSQIILAPAA